LAGLDPAYDDPAGLIAVLRRGIDIDSNAVDYQRLYEKWLSRAGLNLRAQALPLMVGADPDEWRHHVDARGLGAVESALCRTFSIRPIARAR
jgi:hypothetical protein